MRMILAAITVLALLALASTAAAQTPSGMATRTCVGGTCIWQWGEAPEMAGTAKIIRIPQPQTKAEIEAFEARDREWVRICEPVIAPDRVGVPRYRYGPRCPDGVPIGP